MVSAQLVISQSDFNEQLFRVLPIVFGRLYTMAIKQNLH